MNKSYTSRSLRGFTLIEIMLVVATICLLVAIAVPNYLRARKRSQAAKIMQDLRMIDGALDLYSVEFNRTGNEAITSTDIPYIKRYLKTDSPLYAMLPNDMFGNAFIMTNLNTPPSVNPATFAVLSDVAPAEFWSPYGPP